ncbi:hypothetical protein D3C75_929410 [compost metagenome]
MGDDRHIQLCCKLHCILHHLSGLYPYTVIGETNCSGFLECGKVGQLAAKFIFGDRRIRQHFNESGFARFVFDKLHDLRGVCNRAGVRHAGDGGESALGRR